VSGSNKLFRHKDTARSRRETGDLAEAMPAVTRVEVGSLEADGVQHGGDATPPSAFFFKGVKDGRADACVPVVWRI
jgi:hypothetical protein